MIYILKPNFLNRRRNFKVVTKSKGGGGTIRIQIIERNKLVYSKNKKR